MDDICDFDAFPRPTRPGGCRASVFCANLRQVHYPLPGARAGARHRESRGTSSKSQPGARIRPRPTSSFVSPRARAWTYSARFALSSDGLSIERANRKNFGYALTRWRSEGLRRRPYPAYVMGGRERRAMSTASQTRSRLDVNDWVTDVEPLPYRNLCRVHTHWPTACSATPYRKLRQHGPTAFRMIHASGNLLFNVQGR